MKHDKNFVREGREAVQRDVFANFADKKRSAA